MSLRLSTVILPYVRWHEGGRSDLAARGAARVPHRFHLRPPVLADLPRRPLVRCRAHADRRRRRHRPAAPGHPGDLAELPAPGDPRQGADLPRRHLDGRITLGIGAGGTGFDATALGQDPWTPAGARRPVRRVRPAARPAADRGRRCSYEGDFYSAHEARNIPGCVQRPRLPFAVAATGPRGLKLAARHGQAWVTTGDPKLFETRHARAVAPGHARPGRQARPTPARRSAGTSSELDKILLTGFTPDRGHPLESLDAFVDFAGRHGELGFTEHRDPLADPRLRLRRRREGLRADRHGSGRPAALSPVAADPGSTGCDGAGEDGTTQVCGPPHGRARICGRMST